MPAVGLTVPVLVIGPHDLITTSVVAALRAHGFDSTERNAHPVAPETGGGVAVVNLDIADAAGIVAETARCGWSVVAVGHVADPERMAAAVAAGASAQVMRSVPLDELIGVVQGLVDGGPAMPDEERQVWLKVDRVARVRVEARRMRLDSLTGREFEVLRRLERGERAADIAVNAVVAISTVRSHIRSILVKLEVSSQQQAIELYREARRP